MSLTSFLCIFVNDKITQILKIMKHLLVFFILCSCISLQGQEMSKDFLNKSQLKDLYKSIVQEIDYLDAEGIAVRNSTKTVSWEQYKKYHKKPFTKSKTFQELEENFKNFGSGFVCGHSDFDFLYTNEKDKAAAIKSDIKIGFTYPDVSFFDLKSKKTIKLINGKPINAVFEHFLNYQTANNTLNDCQNAFVKAFEKGRLLVDGEKLHSITFQDETAQKITFSPKISTKSFYEIYSEAIVLEGKYKDWQVVEQGYKVAVLQQKNVALVKIKDFIYFKGRGGEMACQEAAKDSTQCSDIQIIRKALKKIADETDYLVIDLQGNYGGQENTWFLSELCPNDFYDLRVQYKKTPLLKNDTLRPYLFYNSERAENWYQNLAKSSVYKQIDDGDFLPIRADFCRGDELCEMKPISPTGTSTQDFEQIIVLVNEDTASSADDFAYRMNEYGNALMAGQPQSADLTYSLVGVLFYIDKKGDIQKTYVGNRQQEHEVNGTELLKFSIPYSKTVDKNGHLLQGKPLKLDVEVPITKDNFENREENTLQIVVQKLTNK